MSIPVPPSSSWVRDDWEALVAREVVRQGEIEAAFDRADACERVGDFQLALESLDRASELSGGLSPACRAQRAHLARQALIGPHRGVRRGPSRTCVWFEIDFEG